MAVHPPRQSAPLQARVSKRLAPGQNGTKRFHAQYGDALVCVRYRQDARKRYTTIEIVVDQQDLPPSSIPLKDILAVPIGYPETELRARAKAEGACWDAQRRLWIMPRAVAKRLGIEGRGKIIETGDFQ